ncbi:DUF721 domain-containing protein [Allopusillimonas ginsengisoli]|nr:DUF721 domain-containing protein [Allopusillimonas ginsengisoli]
MTRMPRSSSATTGQKAAPASLAVSWLGSDQHGASVLTAARNLLAAEEATKAVLPPALAAVCRVARIDRQQLTLAVPSAAYASKLRQLAPRIIHLLNQKGWNLESAQVRVQAALQQNTTTALAREAVPLDENALQAFDTLRSQLRPGPLADAVSRLLAHHRS